MLTSARRRIARYAWAIFIYLYLVVGLFLAVAGGDRLRARCGRPMMTGGEVIFVTLVWGVVVPVILAEDVYDRLAGIEPDDECAS